MHNHTLSFTDVTSFLDQISKDLLINKEPQSLYNPINYLFLKKGKKIRGLLALLSHNLFRGQIKDVKNLVLAIESLHDFTLIHDDVMDNSHLRRGAITINKKWSNNQAILSGDVLLINAYNHLLRLKKSNKILLKSFTKTAIQICEGQQLDFDMQLKKTITLDDYFNMINLKTGALIKFSLVSAALLTRLGKSHVHIMESIGNCLGHLFQIQDDYLDLYGREPETGKIIGGDIFEAKKTFLYITALNTYKGQEKQKLINVYHANDKNKLSNIQDLYSKLGIKEITESTIKDLSMNILALTSSIDIDFDRKKVFIDFINIILHRKQ